MFGNLFKVGKTIFNKILSRENVPRLVTSGIITGTVIGLNVLIPNAFTQILSSFSSHSSFSFASIIDLSTIELAAIYSVAFITSKVLQQYRNVLHSPIITRTTYKLVKETAQHLLRLSHRYHASVDTGKNNETVITCIVGTSDFTTQFLNIILPTGLETIVLGSIFLTSYGSICLITLGGTLMVYTIYSTTTAPYIADAMKQFIRSRYRVTRAITSFSTNFETIKIFNTEEYELVRLQNDLNIIQQAATRNLVIPAYVSLGQWAIIGGGLMALTLYTAAKVTANEMTKDDFILINYYYLQFTFPLASFGDGVSRLKAANMNLQELIQFLEQEPDIKDEFPNNHLRIEAPHTAIKFDKVTFYYNEAEPILDKASFEIPAMKTTAIVSISGKGKTTLARLIYRLYDVVDGKILINGIDIRRVSIKSLRALLAYVPQQPMVFNDTLKNNIWYGAVSKKGPIVNEADIANALNLACLSDYVQRLEQGLDTEVGERGVKISGGQLQRLAFARAIVRDASIILLDEHTSALDADTEEKMLVNMKEFFHGKTCIIIAQKLSTIKDADKIIVLDGGKVVEEGNHDELVSLNGQYAKLWDIQSKSYGRAENLSTLPQGHDDIKENLSLPTQSPSPRATPQRSAQPLVPPPHAVQNQIEQPLPPSPRVEDSKVQQITRYYERFGLLRNKSTEKTPLLHCAASPAGANLAQEVEEELNAQTERSPFCVIL